MSNNTEFKQPYVMFERFDNVIFKPVNPFSETTKKYEATIFKDSEKNNNQIIHYLKFKSSSIKNGFNIDDTKIRKSDNNYTNVNKYPNLSPSMKDSINYSIGLRYPEDPRNNNELFMKITFEDYKNNNVVYMQNKINSKILQNVSLKSVNSNLKNKNKSIRLYQNKHNQPVKLTPSIIQIEKEMHDFHNKCEDGIVKLNEKLNAEIELQYGLQKGLFDNTIHRLGHKKSSKNTFSKRRAKSVGGIKSCRKSRRK